MKGVELEEFEEAVEEIVEEYMDRLTEYFDLPHWIEVLARKRQSSVARTTEYTIIIGKGVVDWMMSEKGYTIRQAILETLVHELLHFTGLRHDSYGHALGFYSRADLDTYTPKVVKKLKEENII